jgi:hypothetical protein
MNDMQYECLGFTIIDVWHMYENPKVHLTLHQSFQNFSDLLWDHHGISRDAVCNYKNTEIDFRCLGIACPHQVDNLQQERRERILDVIGIELFQRKGGNACWTSLGSSSFNGKEGTHVGRHWGRALSTERRERMLGVIRIELFQRKGGNAYWASLGSSSFNGKEGTHVGRH